MKKLVILVLVGILLLGIVSAATPNNSLLTKHIKKNTITGHVIAQKGNMTKKNIGLINGTKINMSSKAKNPMKNNITKLNTNKTNQSNKQKPINSTKKGFFGNIKGWFGLK